VPLGAGLETGLAAPGAEATETDGVPVAETATPTATGAGDAGVAGAPAALAGMGAMFHKTDTFPPS